jgi:aminopeptidase 2
MTWMSVESSFPQGARVYRKTNADHDGFFRTSYSSTHLEKLTKAALQNQLSLRDCIGLLADLSALTAAGINRTSKLLSACLGFKSMADFPVWRMIDQNLTKVMSIWKFDDAALRDGLQKLSSDILGPKSRELGWTMLNSDDESQMEFKAAMFSAAGLADDKT